MKTIFHRNIFLIRKKKQVICPSDFLIKPVKIFIVVVFPEPLGPIKLQIIFNLFITFNYFLIIRLTPIKTILL